MYYNMQLMMYTLVKSNDGKEYLIPSIEKFVPTIDIEENKMIINPIKGMLD